jgi:hypothetical protein
MRSDLDGENGEKAQKIGNLLDFVIEAVSNLVWFGTLRRLSR